MRDLSVVGGKTKNASCSELGDENASGSELGELWVLGAWLSYIGGGSWAPTSEPRHAG